MGTELINPSSMSYEEIAKLTGQSTGNRNEFPRLAINHAHEDDDGNKIPAGAYFVYTDKGAVYAKTATFRPFINSYQYQEYDEKEKKFPNKSVIIRNIFNEEAPDEQGTLKCGKLSKKQLDGATAKQLELQKRVKCYRLLWGTATLVEPVTAKGEAVEVENLPVLWRSTGSVWTPIQDVLEILAKAKRPIFNHRLQLLPTKRHKNAGNVYYVPDITVDMTDHAALTQEDIELLRQFNNMILEENRPIREKHAKALKGKRMLSDDDDEVALAGVVSSTNLDDDFNDAIPDLAQ